MCDVSGVGAFTKVYGGRKRDGTCPNHFCPASGSVIRNCLQTLEEINWVQKHPDGGRMLSKQGRKDLDRIASQIKQKQAQNLLPVPVVIG